MRMKSLLAASAVVFAIAATPASAQVAGIDAMKEWNLIVLGDLASSSEVEGRTFVGGNLTGNSSNYQIRPVATSPRGTPGLTVVGDVNGGHKNLNNGSGAVVGGNVNSGFNLNGGVQTVKVGGSLSNTNINQNIVQSGLGAKDPSFLVDLNQQKSLLQSSLTGLSSTLKGMDGNSTLTINGNRGTFTATPGSDGIAVFNITAADLDRIGEIQFNLNGATTAIINVSGQTINLNDNFLGGTSGLGEKVIWNFPDATKLTSTTAWGGSVLAPNAAANTGNYIEGSAVFGSLVQNGEMHLGTFNANFTPPAPPPTGGGDGPTPVPEEALGLFALGAAGLFALHRRRRRKQAAA